MIMMGGVRGSGSDSQPEPRTLTPPQWGGVALFGRHNSHPRDKVQGSESWVWGSRVWGLGVRGFVSWFLGVFC